MIRTLLAVSCLALTGCSHDSGQLPSVFARQIASINDHRGSPPVLIPSELHARTKHLYPTGGPNSSGYDLELAGARNCGGADTCFLADFTAVRGEKLTGRVFHLANGDRAVYHDISCGGSCAPATIEFVHGGVLYSFQTKVGGTSKKALTNLADEAIAAGPR
jgi:hypothetical protein